MYVNDMVIAAKELSSISWFKKKLSKIFKTKDLGEINKVLGIKIIRDRKNRILTIDQLRYINKVLNYAGITYEKHAKTKIPINNYDCIRPKTAYDQDSDTKKYQKIIGSIMHAMVYTRPDIAFALEKLS